MVLFKAGMIRLSKLTDYGLVLMSYAARNKGRTVHTARELSLESGLPLPTVSKLLKLLLQAGLFPDCATSSGAAPSKPTSGSSIK